MPAIAYPQLAVRDSLTRPAHSSSRLTSGPSGSTSGDDPPPSAGYGVPRFSARIHCTCTSERCATSSERCASSLGRKRSTSPRWRAWESSSLSAAADVSHRRARPKNRLAQRRPVTFSRPTRLDSGMDAGVERRHHGPPARRAFAREFGRCEGVRRSAPPRRAGKGMRPLFTLPEFSVASAFLTSLSGSAPRASAPPAYWRMTRSNNMGAWRP